jgi:chromosome partitioning protein
LHVISFSSRKGGSGKSTLAAHLSVFADRPNSPALLVDTDPQGSLAFWHELRAASTPLLVKCDHKELGALLDDARREGIEWVFIDTPPHASNAIADAMRASDMIVIPLRPAVFDIAAVAATLDMAKAINKPVLPVINAAPARRILGEPAVVHEARQALNGMGASAWTGQVTNRAAFAHALASGQAVNEFEPSSPAAKEMSGLWEVVKAMASGKPIKKGRR